MIILVQASNTCIKTANQKRIYGGMQKWWMWIWIVMTWITPIFYYIQRFSDDITDFIKIDDSDYFLDRLVNDYLKGCNTDPIDVSI